MTMNWLEGMQQGNGPGRAIAMPVFAGQKLAVVGGSSGMGRQTAADVVAAGGSAVIIAEDADKVDDTVQILAKDGTAYGITADLTDRMQAERVCQQLAAEHADATLLVNAAGLFIPKPFLDYALELAPHQIRVNAVAPAVVATRPTRGSFPRTSSMRPCTASTASTRPAGPAPSATWPTPPPSCSQRPPAGLPAPSGTSTAASWPGGTNNPRTPVRRRRSGFARWSGRPRPSAAGPRGWLRTAPSRASTAGYGLCSTVNPSFPRTATAPDFPPSKSPEPRRWPVASS
jgi:NAD(P)-dependent dehydrogenase (short-subunit alcohol dehydrogenase family)